MGFTCGCNEYDPDVHDYYFEVPDDFTKLETKYSRKCSSCGHKINVGDECVRVCRVREPRSDIERRICGDEVRLAPRWLCSDCGEKFLNLSALGYCVTPDDDMDELMKEYHRMTGFEPQENLQAA